MRWHMMLPVWFSVLAAPVAAQSSPVIVAARAAGQIGERYDGYLG